MMTIKEFALLCGCNAQTLRYYDKIDLLKPVKVDQWSGYRYYDGAQAVDFVKIKNLQTADFSIEEIKGLLAMEDAQVFAAFDRKISEQLQKLERIREIQHSYLNEKNHMEKLVENLSDYLLHALRDFDVLREFGLAPEDGAAVVSGLKEYIETNTLRTLSAEADVCMSVDGKVFRGVEQVAEAFRSLQDTDYSETVLFGEENLEDDKDFTPDNSEIVWQCSDWNHVYEFIDRIPQLGAGCEHCFFFRLANSRYREGLEFPLFMIAAMLPKVNAAETTLGCSVQASDDGKNYFALLRRTI